MAVHEAAAPMEDYRKVLRTVGTVLIVVGLLDIGWMAYCISRWWSYSSSFNIFAVIVGIVLCRGSLRAARLVALYGAFSLTAFAAAVLVLPFALQLPLALVRLYFRLYPLPTIASALFLVAVLALLVWTYRMLTQPPVLVAMDQQQIDYRHWRRRPSSGFLAGALLLVIVFAAAGLGFRGTRDEVKERVQREVGPGYHVFVSSMTTSSTAGGPTVVQAEAIIYNDDEIKAVPVEFER